MRPTALFLLAVSALAQNPAPPAFEVASVKINHDPSGQYHQEIAPASVSMRNVTLKILVAWAYHVQRPAIVGPAWFDDQRYDILAKAGWPAKEDEMRPMMVTLLAERFHLAVHRETREMEVMAFVEPKGGHKVTPSQVEGEPQVSDSPGGGKLIKGVALMELAEDVSHDVAMPVLDMTGLKGRFDFTFNPQKYLAAARASVMADPQHRPSEAELRVTVMQDLIAGDTGLRLEARRAPVELVVVDRCDKAPVEN